MREGRGRGSPSRPVNSPLQGHVGVFWGGGREKKLGCRRRQVGRGKTGSFRRRRVLDDSCGGCAACPLYAFWGSRLDPSPDTPHSFSLLPHNPGGLPCSHLPRRLGLTPSCFSSSSSSYLRDERRHLPPPPPLAQARGEGRGVARARGAWSRTSRRQSSRRRGGAGPER